MADDEITGFPLEHPMGVKKLLRPAHRYPRHPDTGEAITELPPKPPEVEPPDPEPPPEGKDQTGNPEPGADRTYELVTKILLGAKEVAANARSGTVLGGLEVATDNDGTKDEEDFIVAVDGEDPYFAVDGANVVVLGNLDGLGGSTYKLDVTATGYTSGNVTHKTIEIVIL
jgi:hypothetical protein